MCFVFDMHSHSSPQNFATDLSILTNHRCDVHMSCNTEGVVDLVSVRLKYDAGKIVDRDDGVA